MVNARHIKNVPGHKTDKKDSEWGGNEGWQVGLGIKALRNKIELPYATVSGINIDNSFISDKKWLLSDTKFI